MKLSSDTEVAKITRCQSCDDQAWCRNEACPSRASSPLPMVDKGGYTLHPRNMSLVHDLSDPIQVHVNTAEAILRRGIRSHQDLPVIHKLIEFNYIENKNLEDQFNAKKEDFRFANRDANEVLLFHGTSPGNTDNICTGNFILQVSNRFVFGRGIYFSKCPNVSLQYGKDLILCRVLLGLKQNTTTWDKENKQTLQKDFDSLEIDWMSKNDPGSNALVIRSPEQVLPYCVIRSVHSGGKKLTGQPLMTIRIIVEDNLDGHQGYDHYNPHTVVVKEVKVKTTDTLGELIHLLSDKFQTEHLRIWPFKMRTNLTVRAHPIDMEMDINKAIVDVAEGKNTWDIFLQMEFKEGVPQPLPSFDLYNDVLLFLKYYDPAEEKIHYMGHIAVPITMHVSKLRVALTMRAQLPEDTSLDIYEEIKPNMFEAFPEKDHRLEETVEELMDGDILVYQKSITDENLRNATFRFPYCMDYFRNVIKHTQ